jgi:predicted esterase
MTHDLDRDLRVLTAGRKLPEAAGALVLLHGRGASAEDILGLGEQFDHPELALFAPQAAGNSWYPYSFLVPIEQNEPWLTSALSQVKSLVEEITERGIPQERITIAGFSQGACLATEFVARNASRYGGLIAFSGGLIGPPEAEFRYIGNLDLTPAFLGSGDPDPHVPWQRVEESASVLAAMGAEVTLHRYPGMPHTVSRHEIEQARQLLVRTLRGTTIDSKP